MKIYYKHLFWLFVFSGNQIELISEDYYYFWNGFFQKLHKLNLASSQRIGLYSDSGASFQKFF